MLAQLADVELALNALRAETRRLAIRQLEEQAANLEVMKESGAFGLQDWRDALKEVVFAAVSVFARLCRPRADGSWLKEACVIVAKGDELLPPLIRRVARLLDVEDVDPTLLPYFHRRLFAMKREHEERIVQAAQYRLDVLRARAEATRYVLTRAGPAQLLLLAQLGEASAGVDRLIRDARRELAALNAAVADDMDLQALPISLVAPPDDHVWYGMPDLAIYDDAMAEDE